MKKILFLSAIFVFIAGCDPVVLITSPEYGASFDTGAPVAFSCTAIDFEDGQLTGDSLVWTSDIDTLRPSNTAFSDM